MQGESECNLAIIAGAIAPDANHGFELFDKVIHNRSHGLFFNNLNHSLMGSYLHSLLYYNPWVRHAVMFDSHSL